MKIEEQISNWHQALLAQPGLSSDQVDELESHLRETISSLRSAGLENEEAFLVATRRMGSISDLEQEFRVADPAATWQSRALWMTLGVLLYWVLSSANGIISAASLVAGSFLSLEAHLSAWGGIMCQLGFSVAFLVILVLATKQNGSVANGSSKLLVAAGALVALVVVLQIGELGLRGWAARAVLVETFALHSYFMMSWTLLQTIGIMGMGVLLIRAQHRRMQHD